MSFDDRTFDIGGRPYSPRRLTLREAAELADLNAAPGSTPGEIVAAVVRQVVFILRGPDGDPPDPEQVLDDVDIGEALALTVSVWEPD